jgi:hypothetical protein
MQKILSYVASFIAKVSVNMFILGGALLVSDAFLHLSLFLCIKFRILIIFSLTCFL